jgi:hypothetical protein
VLALGTEEVSEAEANGRDGKERVCHVDGCGVECTG